MLFGRSAAFWIGNRIEVANDTTIRRGASREDVPHAERGNEGKGTGTFLMAVFLNKSFKKVPVPFFCLKSLAYSAMHMLEVISNHLHIAFRWTLTNATKK